MSPEVLSAAAGVLLSLAFSYVPGLSGWFASLEGTHKRLVMLAALVLVSAGVFALSCTSSTSALLEQPPACTQNGLLGLLQSLLLALVANQAAYQISPRRA